MKTLNLSFCAHVIHATWAHSTTKIVLFTGFYFGFIFMHKKLDITFKNHILSKFTSSSAIYDYSET